MTPSQVEFGRAFEYGIAAAFRRIYGNATLVQNAASENAREAFEACDDAEQDKIFRGADEAAAFLVAHDPNLRMRDGYRISIQSDMAGAAGDVRDVIIANDDSEVGISAKNRHSAVKHPRLSERRDFGRIWFGIPVSPAYFHTVLPIFGELRTLARQGANWNELADKHTRFYIPVLTAFKDEVIRLCAENADAPQRMVAYMLGNYDFYKVIKENGNVSIHSFNLRGSLGWGRRLNLPTRLVEAQEKIGSDTTLELIFNNGWQLSFRLHSAETRVLPSMKFDVQIQGLPNATGQDITYG